MLPTCFHGCGTHDNAEQLLLDGVVQVAGETIALLLRRGFPHLLEQLIAVGDIALLHLYLHSALLAEIIEADEETCQGPAETERDAGIRQAASKPVQTYFYQVEGIGDD